MMALHAWSHIMGRRRFVLGRRQAMRHTIRRWIAVRCMLHMMGRRQRLRRVWRRAWGICARMRRCGRRALLMCRVVRVCPVYGRRSGMARAVVLGVRVVVWPLTRGLMRVMRWVWQRGEALRVGWGRRLPVRLLQRGQRRAIRRRLRGRRRRVGVRLLRRRLRRDGRRRVVGVRVVRGRRGAAIDGRRRVVLRVGRRVGGRRRRDGGRRIMASPRVHDDAGRSPCGQGEESELQAGPGRQQTSPELATLVRRGSRAVAAKRAQRRG